MGSGKNYEGAESLIRLIEECPLEDVSTAMLLSYNTLENQPESLI